MKNKYLFGATLAALLSIGVLTGCGGDREYDDEGRLILRLKNVYFDNWTGDEGDEYTKFINDKFKVKIEASGYVYKDWDDSVNHAVNGDNLTDVINYNLKAYNFGSTYEYWVNDLGMFKALPDDLSKWPNVKAAINKASNVDKLKIDGKLYGVPILNDVKNSDKVFSNMTYVYRRDIAKQLNVYKENDVYTWEEFNNLVKAFANYAATLEKTYVIADEQWGFPSISNFFKDAPHCYTKDSTGHAINAFTSPKYLEGLGLAQQWVANHYYSPDQYGYDDGKANVEYNAGRAFILYDNFSFANYLSLREKFDTKEGAINLDDATAFLKIKGPDGKFAIEGTENWFSVTMFNADISQEKQDKILDIMDYLLTDEGTKLAVYGLEGYDYTMVDGKVELNPMVWEKGSDGKYPKRTNGAKYLRYMVTLGNDTKTYDPYTDLTAYNIWNAWVSDMSQEKDKGNMRIVKEPEDIAWMSTPAKNASTTDLLNDGNTFSVAYAFDVTKEASKREYGDYPDTSAYVAKLTSKKWNNVLNEINARLFPGA